MSKKKLDTTSISNELSGGASVYFRKSISKNSLKHNKRQKPNKETTELQKFSSPEVHNSITTEVQKSGSSELQKVTTTELQNYRSLKKLDARFNFEQLMYLQRLENEIASNRPEAERGNPKHKRITKASILRVYVELFRQLDLMVDAQEFHNENDFLVAIYEALKKVFKNRKY